MIEVQVRNSEFPELLPTIGIPDRRIKAVLEDDTEAINFARAVLAKYERHPEIPNSYYRYLHGMKFFVNFNETDTAMQQIISDSLLHGEYEPNTTKLLESIIKPGMVCMDVGASIGYFTLLLSKLIGPLGKVYSIEPTENQAIYLRENIEANKASNVEAWQIAAWHETASIHIQCNAGQVADVPGRPLDSIFVVPEPVDFIKIDVDGSEPNVLLGLEETIKRSPNLKMVIEYYPEYIQKMGLNPADALSFLDKYFTYEKIEGDYGGKYCNLYCQRLTT